MHHAASLFALPASILLLIAKSPLLVATNELEWPYNVPSHMKYFPEDEAIVTRELRLQQKLQQQPALGVRKMKPDPDQKFYLDYWSFDTSADDHNFDSWTNSSAVRDLHPCAPLHNNQTIAKVPRHVPFSLWSRSQLDKRDFQCPSGTNSCDAIGSPNSCCPTGETCQVVQDTGLGNIGCCPAGATCAGTLSSCDAGQTACPQNLGGGCCIAGYACLDVGCVYTGTATVLVTPTPTFRASTTTLTLTTVITPAVPSASPTTVTSIKTIVPVPSSVSTSSLIVVPTSSTTTTTSTTQTIPSNVITCSTGFKSCPASLGGGCCANTRACGSGAVCPALSSTNTPNAPVRPTTDTTTTTAAATTITGAGCPTGFYACSAYYQGGCCQVGRDCAKSNCPAMGSTTLVSGSGITIVAPTGNGISTANLATGVCATGWQTCAASNGGGCCPSGYACGASCTATGSGGGSTVIGKEAPQSGALSISDRLIGKGALFGLIMVTMLL